MIPASARRPCLLFHLDLALVARGVAFQIHLAVPALERAPVVRRHPLGLRVPFAVVDGGGDAVAVVAWVLLVDGT